MWAAEWVSLVGVGVGAAATATAADSGSQNSKQTRPSIDRHLRRRAGMPQRNTQANVAPPLAANQPIRRAEGPADLDRALAGVDATMVSVAVVFPLTVTEVGFRLQVNPVGPVHARATEH